MCAMNHRLLRPRASGGGFDPRSIPNLTGWWDATDSASYTESSGQISEWRDKSGRSNHITQSTANNRPTLFESSADSQNSTRSSINGRQSLFFDGSNDRLVTTNTVTSGQSRTVFAVARRQNNDTVGTVANFGNTTVAQADRWLCRYGNNGEKVIGGDSRSTNQLLSSIPTEWTDPHVSCWSQNSSTRNLSYFLNGTSLSISGNPPNTQTSFSGLLVGALAVETAPLIQFFHGHIGSIIVYDSELTAAERTAVTRWLAASWGVNVA